MGDEYLQENNWDNEDDFPVSKYRGEKQHKPVKQELDEWDDEEIFQRARRKGRMRDIEERQERKRLHRDIAWFDSDN